jgi:hypothetical protein
MSGLRGNIMAQSVEMPASHAWPGDIIRRRQREYDVLRADCCPPTVILWVRLAGAGNYAAMEQLQFDCDEIILRRVPDPQASSVEPGALAESGAAAESGAPADHR